MPRFFSAKYQALLWLILNLVLLWLLVQLYARHVVQQQLTMFNYHYQHYARAVGWPLWQLQASGVSFLLWQDELQIEGLQFSLPSGAVLAEVADIRLRGLMASFINNKNHYQLHWQQFEPSAAVAAWLGVPWQGVLQPISGSVQWQQQQHSWQTKGQFAMAGVADVRLRLQWQIIRDAQNRTGLALHQLWLRSQQQGLVATVTDFPASHAIRLQQQLQQWRRLLPPCRWLTAEALLALAWPPQAQLEFTLSQPVIWWLPQTSPKHPTEFDWCGSAG